MRDRWRVRRVITTGEMKDKSVALFWSEIEAVKYAKWMDKNYGGEHLVVKS